MIQALQLNNDSQEVVVLLSGAQGATVEESEVHQDTQAASSARGRRRSPTQTWG